MAFSILYALLFREAEKLGGQQNKRNGLLSSEKRREAIRKARWLMACNKASEVRQNVRLKYVP